MKHSFWLRKSVRPTLLSFATIATILFSPAVVRADNWQVVFEDEFNGTSLDLLKWDTCYWWHSGRGCANHGAQEIQWFLPEEVLVQNGILQIRTQKRIWNAYNATFQYTSGMISSHQRYAFQYGFVEIRAKVPKGRGFWPTMWLAAEDRNWPPEVNIAEFVGSDMKSVLMVLHYINDRGKPKYSSLSWGNNFDFSEDYHVYAVLWEPNAIIWYVDGVERMRYTNSENIPQKPMYILTTLAIGPIWTNKLPDDSTPFPSYFDIDYIKVWQRQ
ncbi:MAG: Endo-1,3-1,4-beta-glycanase ExsH [Chroococcidiopsis sp. SAG 2025]|uniref:glycoside hydrolase family 16 protein n=1 Tax=Chroococcidiopsis sp. SAG 2025 TaxID=171389 RepID=UPI00293733B1|nr:glycoside hydrolase family 16 protein [Chroococcidiopsis sp. SAG 2025]MDV2996075.1 Endo-1,3-1,4-beta-glycanase ExsH [Chroococcidiopsis sp. SAG 2025]